MNNTTQNLELAFDVGHDSIGWSVLGTGDDAPGHQRLRGSGLPKRRMPCSKKENLPSTAEEYQGDTAEDCSHEDSSRVAGSD